MKTKMKTVFAVSWAEYNHNDSSLNTDTYGIYKTKAAAKKAIRKSISGDIELLLEDYEDVPGAKRPYGGKSPEEAAKEIMEGFVFDQVIFEMDDGREMCYTMRAIQTEA